MNAPIQFHRQTNDINGNPRYVVHFLECEPEAWSFNPNFSERYPNVVKLMNSIGGRKYHNKKFGGGIIFQSYSLAELENSINDLKNNKGE